MLHLLQADPLVSAAVDNAETTAKEVLSGDTSALSALASHCLDVCVEVGKSILLALLIYIVGRFVIRGINLLISKMMERKGVDATIQGFLKNLVNITLTILLLVAVISALGVNTTSFAALIASIGIAFGMALSGNLQNLAGGLVILFLKPFRVGDTIEAMGNTGTVRQIQLFHTILTTADNKTVFLPNGALSSGTVTNCSNDVRRVDLTVSVPHGTKDEDVRKALGQLIEGNAKILATPERKPFIAISAIKGSLEYTVRLWARQEDYWDVYHYMQEGVYTTFAKAGIAIC
ncbi:MAG: mechanosensitive ion channel [Prevotellaceae bacterium]|nr:mechanosensitive ion channel [Prevotellaceae bacterium]